VGLCPAVARLIAWRGILMRNSCRKKSLPPFARGLAAVLWAQLIITANFVIPVPWSGAARAANLTTLVSFCAQPNCAAGPGGLIIDANGNLLGTTLAGGAHFGGTVFEIVKTASGYASSPTTLVSFCGLFNCTPGPGPGNLIMDANGNLFGTTEAGGTSSNCLHTSCGSVFEIVKTVNGYASSPTTLVSFCALPQCADGQEPGGLVMDANGNLFGTTLAGGAHHGSGTVFEIVKTANGYASTPTTLYSFCALPHCADGALPVGLVMDAKGNLFGTTNIGGTLSTNCNNFYDSIGRVGCGTVFEIAKTATGYASSPTVIPIHFGRMGVEYISEACNAGHIAPVVLVAKKVAAKFVVAPSAEDGGDIEHAGWLFHHAPWLS
jgi:hypothetical protein